MDIKQKFRSVARYDLVYYDSQWTELPDLGKSLVTAHEMIELMDKFNTAQQKFLRSGDVFGEGVGAARYVSVGVTFVEI